MDLGQIKQAFKSHGATHLLVKSLSANDNSKNQVYLGGNFEVINVLPYGDLVADGTRVKASLRLSWMGEDGALEEAPAAQLILYPQYPEVRFSGFLRGCGLAPSELMGGEARVSGRRLLLGVRADGRIIAWVCGPDHAVAKELENHERRNFMSPGDYVSVFLRIDLLGDGAHGSRAELMSRLSAVSDAGWLEGNILRKDGSTKATNSKNGVGHTLEAALGVSANGLAEPDFMGWELKSFGVDDFEASPMGKRLTVITPEPKLGVYAEEGVESFVRRFGYPDKRGRPDRLNFGGQYRVDRPYPSTGLQLKLSGYEAGTGTRPGKVTDLTEGALELRAPDGSLAAGWRFSDLIGHWQSKHANAAYVPALTRLCGRGRRQFRYAPFAWLGERTDFLRLVEALHEGSVVYDPGIKLEDASTSSPRPKKRSQFRILFRDLPALYESFERSSADEA